MNKLIDHTLLKADATKEMIVKLCEEAKTYHFFSVCVNSYWVKTCADLLQDSDVKVACVVGFPLGASTSEDKASEAARAISNGASEIDMVANIGAIKDHDYKTVTKDIAEVKAVCKDKILKVIIETCLLSDEEKVEAAKCVVSAKADFVKTSTGFSTGGATVADVALIKSTVGDKALIKASGGVRSRADVKAMVKAGANRIGTSGGVKLMQE